MLLVYWFNKPRCYIVQLENLVFKNFFQPSTMSGTGQKVTVAVGGWCGDGGGCGWWCRNQF